MGRQLSLNRGRRIVPDSSPEPIADEVTVSETVPELQRRRRKRHRAHRQKRLEQMRKKALIAFLYALTIGLTLAIWYELLNS
jgi:hypothetical protein